MPDNMSPPSSSSVKYGNKAVPSKNLVEAVKGARRIVVYHLNGVGDLLFSLPALLAIRQAFPKAEITSILRPFLRELLEPSQLVDHILLRPEAGGKLKIPLFLHKLRKEHFDLAVLFSQSASMNLYARASGTKLRIGFIDTIFPKFLSHALPLRGITCTAKLLYLTEQLGAQPQKRDYVGLLKISEAQRAKALALLQEVGLRGERLVIFSFAQGAGLPNPHKTWLHESFVETGLRFSKLGLRPVIIGAAADAKQGLLLAQDIGKSAVSLAGRTGLGELAGVIQQAALFVGIDSGPTHIAAALGIPVIALYGPTDPSITGPQGNMTRVIRKDFPCSPCREPTCQGRPCMEAITPEEVVAAAMNILDGKSIMQQGEASK
jgi:ADP-heptose:LPS heptosyltransferase